MSQLLSLSEAAKRLGISREAAYKRVKRGTLRHVKGSDGLMYVRSDDVNTETTGGNDGHRNTKEPTSGANGGSKRPSWDLTSLSALVAIAGALISLIYVSGLFVLWAPIARRYTHDVATSWHAVSLIPKTSVIGHGFISIWFVTILNALLVVVMEVWMLSEDPIGQKLLKAYLWLISIFGLFSSYLIGRYIFGAILGSPPEHFVPEWVPFLSASNSTDTTETPAETFIGMAAGVCIILIVAFFLPRFSRHIHAALEASDNGHPETSPPDAEETNGFIATVGAVFHTARAIWNYRFPRIVSSTNFLKAMAILFTMGFLQAATFAAIAADPPVPRVELIRNEDTNVEGDLLAHAEGFWYVLKPDGEILSIPDDEVHEARVLSQSSSKST